MLKVHQIIKDIIYLANQDVKFHKVVDAFIYEVNKTHRTWGNVMSP